MRTADLIRHLKRIRLLGAAYTEEEDEAIGEIIGILKEWEWERARQSVQEGAKKRGVDLSRIVIVPDSEQHTKDIYVAPWETVRQARKRVKT